MKAAGYLDTKGQDSIQYIFNAPKNNNNNENNNNLPIEPVGDIIDLKKTSATTATPLAAKNLVRKYRNLAKKSHIKDLLKLSMVQNLKMEKLVVGRTL